MIANRNKKRWTNEEDMVLDTYWGVRPMSYFIKTLGRSERAIKHRALTLNLGGAYSNGSYLTIKEIGYMFNLDYAVIKRWVEKYGLRCRRRTLLSQTRYLIDIDELHDWCKENQDKWTTHNLETMALGREEKWLQLKRIEDSKKVKRRTPFTLREDNIIVDLYMRDFTFEEISQATGRSYDSCKHRMKKLRAERNLPYKNAKTNRQVAS